MFYAEFATTNGRWTPTKVYQTPALTDTMPRRLKRVGSLGPKIRQLGTCQKGKPVFWKAIERGHEKLTLDQLRQV